MKRFADRRVVITGATGGLGGAMARGFYSEGAFVGLSGTRLERLEVLGESLGERAKVFPCDLGAREAPQKLISDVEDQFGGIDVLIANAGITRDGLLMRMKAGDWDEVLTVNLTSTAALIRSALPKMMKQRYGRIIVISSVSGVTGNAGQSNYAAAKAGLIGLTRSVAREVATRGITVNAIAPGFIQSPMTDALNDKQRDAILTNIPVNRIGAPEEISHAALYLADEKAAYVTGETLHVNGGLFMP